MLSFPVPEFRRVLRRSLAATGDRGLSTKSGAASLPPRLLPLELPTLCQHPDTPSLSLFVLYFPTISFPSRRFSYACSEETELHAARLEASSTRRVKRCLFRVVHSSSSYLESITVEALKQDLVSLLF